MTIKFSGALFGQSRREVNKIKQNQSAERKLWSARPDIWKKGLFLLILRLYVHLLYHLLPVEKFQFQLAFSIYLFRSHYMKYLQVYIFLLVVTHNGPQISFSFIILCTKQFKISTYLGINDEVPKRGNCECKAVSLKGP